MRLINTRTLELHDFSLSEIPPYAILSHTWGDGEVTFQDMSSHYRTSKIGFYKITQTCRLAQEDGLGFAWVDTCCIDKTSSAELTESINSMFQWYARASVCYVSLTDLPPNTRVEDELGNCRWLTRGWTLQELLAPKQVMFYDMAWNHLGSKTDFVHTISNFTRIPVNALLGRQTLADYSLASRMSWAARRQTTRIEDMAYCLLGIFDVNMALIYGEGPKAFHRLQEEIVKRKNDLTMFAWDVPQEERQQFLGLFAKSPAAFADSSGIRPFWDDCLDFAVTNKGLLVSGDAPLRAIKFTRGEANRKMYALFLGTNLQSNGSDGGICLRKVGPRLFYRDGRYPLAGFGGSEIEQLSISDVTHSYIQIDPSSATVLSSTFRAGAIHVPLDDVFRLEDAVPETLWDLSDRVFLRPKPYNWIRYPMAIAMTFSGKLAGRLICLVVLCDYREEDPFCRVCEWKKCRREIAMIFEEGRRSESILWPDLELKEPSILLLSNSVEIEVGHKIFRISVLLEKEFVEGVSTTRKVFSLKFKSSLD